MEQTIETFLTLFIFLFAFAYKFMPQRTIRRV